MTPPAVSTLRAAGSKERPILFSGEMVRAILDGRKTQTRRVFRNPWGEDETGRFEVGMFYPTVIRRGEEEPGEPVFGAWSLDGEWAVRSPYGGPGDRLWVRETWGKREYREYDPTGAFSMTTGEFEVVYRADRRREPQDAKGWRPSIHMPRWASRLTLEVTGVRVERVRDISETDAAWEGVGPKYAPIVPGGESVNVGHFPAFRDLWDKLNAKRGYGWDADPWVWAIIFRRVTDDA